MISCPDTESSEFAERGASLSSRGVEKRSARRVLTPSDRLVRRVFRAMLGALSLTACFIAAAPAGDTLDLNLDVLRGTANGTDDRPVNLFVDITSNRLADEVKMTNKRRLNLAGVPVVIGAARQSGAASPSVAAGIAGKYDLKLDDHLSLKASGLLSRTHVIETGLLSSARAGGELALQFEDGGTRLQLRPSFYAGMQDDLLHHVDFAFEGRLRQEIGEGFNLTASAGRAWHDDTDFDTEDRDTTFGRVGLHMDLAPLEFLEGGDLELAYQIDTRDGMLASQFRITHGPVLLAHLAATGGWRFTGRYTVSATERGYDDNDPAAMRHDLRQRLSLESDWDLGSSTGADWHMKADYGYERTVTDDPVTTPALHTAMVSFALNF